MAIEKNRPLFVRFGFALSGVWLALRSEASLRTQAAAFVLVTVALFVLRPAPVWWALVLFGSCAVLAAELFNSAIERLADHVQPQLHADIRFVKDCAAAGVLLMVLGALAIAAALVAERFHLLNL
jgi:diacylglycerol kinase (ATP)